MKYYLSIFILTFISSLSSAQDYDKVSKAFVENYNNGDSEAIFNLFSPEMKEFLPIKKTKEFVSSMMQQAGKIKSNEHVLQDNTLAEYKTTFDNVVYTMIMSLDANSNINGLRFKPYMNSRLPKIDRNTTKLILPFKEEWTVIWGGDTKAQNYHVETESQKGAFDMVITDADGKSFKTDGVANEDYYAFGKTLIAPCDAEVVLVVDGIKDNIPGEMNPIYVPGNTVILKTVNNEYLFFAHFKQYSIVVKQGQIVKQGDMLGMCGNSGNSSEPHLHFHIQNVEEMQKATGAKCYFDSILVNGSLKDDYSPIKNEKVKNNH